MGVEKKMSLVKLCFDEVVAELVAKQATGIDSKTAAYHTWDGWVRGGVLFLTSRSGARRKEGWKFGVSENSGRTLCLKNTASAADCWVLPAAAEETDPLSRVLRFCGWSQKINIHKDGEVVKLSGRYENLYHHSPNKKSTKIITSSPEDVIKGEERRDSNLSHSWWYDWEAHLSNATWSITLGERTDSSARIYRFVEAIHIWGNPDVKKMAEVILSWRYSDGADWEFMEAVIHKTSLLSWIMKKLEPAEKFETFRTTTWGERSDWQRKKIGDVPDKVVIEGIRFSIEPVPRSERFQLKASDPGHFGTETQAALEFNRLSVEQQIEVLPKTQSDYLKNLLEKSRQ